MNGPVRDAAGSRGTELTRFDELAGSGLYRDNIFAITGLSATARGAAVRTVRQRAEARLAVQPSWPGDPRSPVSGEYARDVVRAAFEGFQDPRRRLVDELFWHWGEETAGCGCPVELHREHDTAIDAHARAVAAEDGRLDLADTERDRLWTSAATAWGGLLERPELREHLRSRIRALGDPRLGEELVDAFLSRVPGLLVSPFGEFAGRPEFTGRACAPWAALTRFAGPLSALYDERLAETDRVITKELLAAEEQRNAGKYADAVLIMRRKVVPEFERFAAFRDFVSPWRFEEIAHSVAVGLNNLAVELHRHHLTTPPTEKQRRTMIELAEKAHDIAPERDEAQLMENRQLIQSAFTGARRSRAATRGTGQASSSHPVWDRVMGVSCLLICVTFIVLWIVVGILPAVAVTVGGLALLGYVSELVESFQGGSRRNR
ncbi:hypothetical protein [Streptomyces odontomachi]|uniref:hypothetical protein n=1 Tax=Streptomyces odontomachi TaxID=2944940 RepID=UPI00210C05CA|nr:hypothetical protein [Streptomyces sp. ODS25]